MLAKVSTMQMNAAEITRLVGVGRFVPRWNKKSDVVGYDFLATHCTCVGIGSSSDGPFEMNLCDKHEHLETDGQKAPIQLRSHPW